jgi:hypothetical protein
MIKADNKPTMISTKGKRTKNHEKKDAPPLQITFNNQVQKTMKMNLRRIINITVPGVQPLPSQKTFNPLNKKITAITKTNIEKMK